MRDSYLHVWHPVAINKSSRPVLFEDEHVVYIREDVGLYQGRVKVKLHQNGRVYLTNKRIIYVEGADAVAVALCDTVRAEHVERFLRSSPKVKVYLAVHVGTVHAAPPETWRWTCKICLFRNSITGEARATAQCVACGIRPSSGELEFSGNQEVTAKPDPTANVANTPDDTTAVPGQCPACTFINHPSMRTCELCSTPLKAAPPDAGTTSDPNPAHLDLEGPEDYTGAAPYLKLSFRGGGDSEFYAHVVAEIDSTKWAALESANMVSQGAVSSLPSPAPSASGRGGGGGIHLLQKQNELRRRQTEQVLALSLEDLEQLMSQAQLLIGLSSSFRPLIKRTMRDTAPTSALGTGGAVRPGAALFHQELARHICEFLLASELPSVTSMVTVPDLFARYNRFRVLAQGFGAALVLAQDIRTSLALADSLDLPIKIQRYLSGLEVVARRGLVLESLSDRIVAFLTSRSPNEHRGATVAEVAAFFGWAYAVCVEELDRCMDQCLVVYDCHVLGTFYYANVYGATWTSMRAEAEVQG